MKYKDYQLIPIEEITDDARTIAVEWIEYFQPAPLNIQLKHKLASDIMNYAKQYAHRERTQEQWMKALINIVEKLNWDFAVPELEPNEVVQGLIIGTPEYIQSVLNQKK